MGVLVVLFLTGMLWAATPVAAAPVAVQLPEGNARAFFVIRSLGGDQIAHAEFRQKPAGAVVESRLILTFKDGSVRDELSVFSQKGVFRLERYRLVQRGPSFPKMEISFDRQSGQYEAVTQEKKGDEEKQASGVLDMPEDLYNGLAVVLLKNMSPRDDATVQTVVFTPKPRLVKTVLRREEQESVAIAGEERSVIRYVMKLELGGVAGMIAPLIGKEPPDLRYWLVPGEVPAFAKFEGAMFLNGPVWRLEPASPRWR
jgi:hypothetical protein